MTVQDKIKTIVSDSLKGFHYEYNDWTRVNSRLDLKNKLPAFVSILPASGTLLLKSANFRDYPNCMFAFLDKADFDFDGEKNESTVERMKQAAKELIKAMNDSGMFETLPETFSYSVVYDKLDVNVTGIIIEIQPKELIGTCGI